MTGFGVGRAADSGLGIAVEVRSVNNRFFDLSMNLPRLLFPYETDIREMLDKKVQRGRISLFITEEWMEDKAPNIRINDGVVKRYLDLLESVRQKYGIHDEVKLQHLLMLGDVFTSGEDESIREREWELAKQAIDAAMEQLITVSAQEGERLLLDLKNRIAVMQGDLAIIEEWAQKQTEFYANRLRSRVTELIDDNRIDPNRLEMEIALAADRLDISEEITRLKSHIALFNKTLTTDSVGKTLGFVLQEMGREVNTMASKSWVVHISQTAVKMKETLEQIREQVQNIE